MTHAFKPTISIGNVTIHEQTGLYSLNDFHRASGGNPKHQPAYFLRSTQTQKLVQELCSANLHIKPVDTVRGRGKPQGTYVCRELVIAYASWISAEFHLKVIRVFLGSVASTQPTLPRAHVPPYTADQAYALATQTASAVSARLFTAVTSGQAEFSHDRWLILVSNHGTTATVIDPRAVVLTPEQVAEELKHGSVGAHFNQHELAQLASASLARLQQQLDKTASNQPAAENNVVPMRKPRLVAWHEHPLAA